MELKRYVLLSNNTILDTNGTEYYLYEQNKLCGGGGGVIGTIKRSSDNILDLVDVGDMLLRNDDFCYHIIVTDISEDTFYGEHESIWRGNKISHLWKRRANGDYKRYEVKE